MTTNDIKVVGFPGNTLEYDVNDRDTTAIARTIKAGEPVKECGNYVVRVNDDDGGATTDLLMGVAAAESTETASADGTVLVTMIVPALTVLRGAAETSTSADTVSDLLALMNEDVVFGATYESYNSTNEGVISIAEDADDGTNHGLHIVGGSADSKATLDVIVKSVWTAFGAAA